MEYQKVINLLDNTPHRPTQYRTQNCVERITLIAKLHFNVKVKFM